MTSMNGEEFDPSDSPPAKTLTNLIGGDRVKTGANSLTMLLPCAAVFGSKASLLLSLCSTNPTKTPRPFKSVKGVTLQLQTGKFDSLLQNGVKESAVYTGANSKIYKVQCPQTGAFHAVKEITLHGITEAQLEEQEVSTASIREVKTLSDVRSKNVVRFVDGWVEKSVEKENENESSVLKLYIQMEFFGATTLAEWMLQAMHEKDLKYYTRAFQYLLGVCNGLKTLRNAGVLHRNITARSILVEENGTAKIGGFDMSRFCVGPADKKELSPSEVRHQIASPEQCTKTGNKGWVYDHKADTFAFGILVISVVCKVPDNGGKLRADIWRQKFPGHHNWWNQHIHRDLGTDFPKKFRGLATSMIAKEAKARPDLEQIENALQELQRLASHATMGPCPN